MAQPLHVNAQPVHICYFATNNKFTASDVENRVANVTSELRKNRIWVVSYSADGDPRELKMMRETINLGICPPSRIRSKHIINVSMPDWQILITVKQYSEKTLTPLENPLFSLIKSGPGLVRKFLPKEFQCKILFILVRN